MFLKNSEYFNEILLVVGLADLRDLIKVINDEIVDLFRVVEDDLHFGNQDPVRQEVIR